MTTKLPTHQEVRSSCKYSRTKRQNITDGHSIGNASHSPADQVKVKERSDNVKGEEGRKER